MEIPIFTNRWQILLFLLLGTLFLPFYLYDFIKEKYEQKI